MHNMLRSIMMVLALCAAVPTRAAPLSAEQVLTAPLTSELRAAPAGGGLAWVEDDRGVRNLMVATPEGRGYRTRAVTRFTKDDGFEIGEIGWSGDGTTLVFSRGGEIEGGRPTNFEGAADGMPLREIWTVGLDGAAPRKLASGHAPALSPRGDMVAYLSGNVFIVPLDGTAPPRRIVDQGDGGELAWSPDGGRLAFVSERDNHRIIGVFDVATGHVQWMAPSFDEDRAPVWSPDGRHLAFIRVAAHRIKSSLPRRAGEPWSIWVADAASGQASQVFRAKPGAGSVFNGLDGGPHDLIWAAGDRLVFPWERAGWLNLYSVAASGGDTAARPVATGRFEVFSAAISTDHRSIVYASNAGDLDARHLRTVGVDGRGDRALTAGRTFEDRPAIASDGTVAFLRGSDRQPFRPMVLLHGSAAPVVSMPLPAAFAEAAFVAPKVVHFTASDGHPVSGQLFEPAGPPPAGGRPAILFFHGGPARQMLAGYNPSIFYSRSYAMNQFLASHGYVVLSVNYRGGIGYGLDFREAERFGIAGASEVADIRGAATYVGGLSGVNPQRIGIYGASYGGHMTAMGLARVPDLLKSGVDYAGVHDWRAFEPQLARADAPAGAADLAWQSSALSDLSHWTAPVLVAAADDDRDVPFSQSVALVEALRARDVPVETLVLADEVHDLRLHRSWLTWMAATDAFFSRHLAADK